MEQGGGGTEYGLGVWRQFGPAGLALRLGAIGCAVGGAVAVFAYTGGWLTPQRVSPVAVVERFEAAGGRHEGFRRNHAKGVCVAGHFDSSGRGAALSSAQVFQGGRVPVTGRFSLAGGNPFMPDAVGAVRSLALQYQLADGERWRTAMIDLPVFPAATPESFYALQAASRPVQGTGQPDPALMKAFFDRYPESAAAFARIKAEPAATGFADDRYHALNAFVFRAGGTATPVRLSMLPAQAPGSAPGAAPGGATANDANRWFDTLAGQIKAKPLQWDLVAVIGKPGDPIADSTREWPADRERVSLGTVTIDRIEAEGPGTCRDLTFDPLVMPAGIEASDDPILSARSATYAESLARRSGEPKRASAVTEAEIQGAKPQGAKP